MYNQTEEKIHSKRNVNQNLTFIQNQTGNKKIAYSDALKGKKLIILELLNQ